MIDSMPLNTESTTINDAVLIMTPPIAMMEIIFTALCDLWAKTCRIAINEENPMVREFICARCTGGLLAVGRSGYVQWRGVGRSSRRFLR